MTKRYFLSQDNGQGNMPTTIACASSFERIVDIRKNYTAKQTVSTGFKSYYISAAIMYRGSIH